MGQDRQVGLALFNFHREYNISVEKYNKSICIDEKKKFRFCIVD